MQDRPHAAIIMIVVSHSQTALSSLVFGQEEKGSGECSIYHFCSVNPQFLGIVCVAFD